MRMRYGMGAFHGLSSVATQLQIDYDAYWTATNVGDSRPLAGGTIRRVAADKAVLTIGTQSWTLQRGVTTPEAAAANIPALKAAWLVYYGANALGSPTSPASAPAPASYPTPTATPPIINNLTDPKTYPMIPGSMGPAQWIPGFDNMYVIGGGAVLAVAGYFLLRGKSRGGRKSRRRVSRRVRR